MAKENDLQNAICEYLTLKKYFFWRNNNVPMVYKTPTGEMRFRKLGKYAMKGIPDIIVITDGGFAVFIEVKAPKSYQSKEQKEFEKRVKDLGGEYYVIKKIEEVLQIL
jgi:hypothetical protein